MKKKFFFFFLLTFQTIFTYNFLKSIEIKEANLVEAIAEILQKNYIHKSSRLSISKSVNIESSVADIITGVLQATTSNIQIIFAKFDLLISNRYTYNIFFADDLNGFRFVIFSF